MMKKTTITNLPIRFNKKYYMTINRVFESSMIISIDNRKYYISTPKNSSSIHVSVFDGMECIVLKEQYFSGTKEYAKLTFIESYEDAYFEEENNYKETATYSNNAQYYKILGCSIDASSDTINNNYKKLIRAYHYDILVSKNLPTDMLEFAQNKAELINDMHEILKK